ncbi:MAG TPA: cytochrome c biogenesis protein ResB [Mariprofundaceae bacterium]|nr:cytochrome c biogenesis protein ResB [Mariprofundaceae bacterium]
MNNLNESLKQMFVRLGSMTLAVAILCVLAIASVIGTVLLQNQEQADYLNQFGQLWYWTFRSLGLFDMYHTWWFLTLLAFLMVSLAVCLWRNVPHMLKEMRMRKVVITDKSLKHFHHLHHWKLGDGADMADVKRLAERELSGWETLEAEKDGAIYLRGDKGRFHKWGYILAHAAVLIILIGGWISVHYGFRGNMSVPEGQSDNEIEFLRGTAVHHLQMPFSVRCNSFHIAFYPSGPPKEFRSNLSIIDHGKVVMTKDIIVNEPLKYKGVRIYQASFGDGGSAITLKLFGLDGSEKVDTVKTRVYQTWKDPKTGVSLEITDFRPFNIENMAGAGQPKDFHDLGPAVEFIVRGPGLKPVKIKSYMNPFVYDGQNRGTLMEVSESGDGKDYQPFLLGLDFTNPKEWELFHAFVHAAANLGGSNTKEERFKAFNAALKQVYGDKRPKDFQDLGVRLLQGMNSLPRIPWPFIPILDDYDQVYYTGLQLTEDPGMNVVWTGSVLLVLGLCIMFYMPHRKLWLVIRPAGKGEGLEVSVAGMTNRNLLGFEKEFQALQARLNATFESS